MTFDTLSAFPNGIRTSQLIVTGATGSPTGTTGTILQSTETFAPTGTLNADAQIFYSQVWDYSNLDSTTPKFNTVVGTFVNANGTRNNVVQSYGWNLANSGRQVSGEPGIGLVMESYYKPTSATGQNEIHITTFDTNGTEHRLWTSAPVRDGSSATTSMSASTLNFTDYSNNIWMAFLPGNQLTSVLRSMFFQYEVNNAVVATQKNTAGSAYVNLPFINSSDRLYAGSPGAYVGATPTGGDYPNVFFSLAPTTVPISGQVLKGFVPHVAGDVQGVNISGQVDGNLDLFCFNSSTASNTCNARLVLQTQSSGSGGAFVYTTIAGLVNWSFGANVYDSTFTIANDGTVGGSNQWVQITKLGSVLLGNNVALGTTATDGFLYINSCGGTAAGTPTSRTGAVPMVYDTTHNKLFIYNSGWKSATFA